LEPVENDLATSIVTIASSSTLSLFFNSQVLGEEGKDNMKASILFDIVGFYVSSSAC
jgi:hypothetical protein